MIIKKLHGLFLCVLIGSCTHEVDENIPVGLLPQQKMTTILVEKHIQKASFNLRRINNGTLADTVEFSLILEKMKIKNKDFETSMKYYAEHPKLMNEIYDEVINELSRRQAKSAKKK